MDEKTLLFVEKARKVHGGFYDYRKTKYVDIKTRVSITCPIHGDFQQIPGNHLQGAKCRKCGMIILSNKRQDNTESFVLKARKIHGDKYNYDNVIYVASNKKVIINCPIHGNFEQAPNNHIRGYGCRKCGITARINKLKDNQHG